MLQRIKHAVGFSRQNKGRRRVRHGSFLSKGQSNRAMEDFAVSETKVIDDHDVGLFAIYDGHLGHEVAEYLHRNLLTNILNQPSFWTDPTTAVAEAYVQTDLSILEETDELVLCREGSPVQLTVDHDPLSEKAYIQRKGGMVTVLPGDVPRVNGQLAVGRAFGDKNLKTIIRVDPDVFCVLIQMTDEFLILASDGLWKVVDNQTAVDLVREVKDPKAAARQLVEYAIQQNSKDDISCVVVRFH